MRIRFSTTLDESLKAWFYIDESKTTTIAILKTELCSQLPILTQAGLRPGDIRLLLDDFELLDGSSINILKESDLICLAPSTSKRKASPDEEGDKIPQKRRKGLSPNSEAEQRSPARPSQPSSSSSSESTSESSDADSSDGSSDSDSSEDSSDEDDTSMSSDSSSSSSPPPSQPIVKSRATPASRQPIAIKASEAPTQPPKPKGPGPAHLTPPGYGKPQTIKRNERRRRKRQYERDPTSVSNLQTQPLTNFSTANNIPLGTRPSISQTVVASNAQSPTPPPATTVVDPLAASMIATLSNKNKRRGFKAAPTVLPAKVIFSDDATAANSPPQTAATTAASTLPSVTPVVTPSARVLTATPLPRLVPPSERQEMGLLPPRMFVTSVDVEEGKWNKGQGRSKKKKALQSQQLAEEEYFEELDVVLDYDDDETFVTADRNQDNAYTTELFDGPRLDWDGIEQKWLSLPLLKDIVNLKQGVIVGWKALAINPATFTPEMMLHAARIVKVEQDNIIVRQLFRPEAVAISFGGPVDVDEQIPGEGEDETIASGEAINAEWRIIG